MFSRDQEQRIIEALVAIDWMESEQKLITEGIGTIEQMLCCLTDQATAMLKDYRDRDLIEPDISRGGQLDARKPMPVARWKWVRPSTSI